MHYCVAQRSAYIGNCAEIMVEYKAKVGSLVWRPWSWERFTTWNEAWDEDVLQILGVCEECYIDNY